MLSRHVSRAAPGACERVNASAAHAARADVGVGWRLVGQHDGLEHQRQWRCFAAYGRQAR